jgi:hypothetical protein
MRLHPHTNNFHTILCPNITTRPQNGGELRYNIDASSAYHLHQRDLCPPSTMRSASPLSLMSPQSMSSPVTPQEDPGRSWHYGQIASEHAKPSHHRTLQSVLPAVPGSTSPQPSISSVGYSLDSLAMDSVMEPVVLLPRCPRCRQTTSCSRWSKNCDPGLRPVWSLTKSASVSAGTSWQVA